MIRLFTMADNHKGTYLRRKCMKR